MARLDRLVLFDVDGTLIKQWSGAPSQSGRLIKKYFNLDSSKIRLEGGGMTDRQIIVEKLKRLGLENPDADPRLAAALLGYTSITKEIMDEFGIEQVPGAERLVKRLIDEGISVGLLTGNTPGRARIKLEAVGLWNYFKIGAFGDATTKRSELVPIALRKAKEKTGISFRKSCVFILGDTVRDIMCAREAGTKSIAVATGKQTFDALAAESPDFVFRDFSNIEAMLLAVIGKM
ncbi:MAG: HAD family hydrolase [Candidatus Micrarchaeota archaeon]|nr:HAD family hydrolase [Candidatus Micrarchaeota archaeon]